MSSSQGKSPQPKGGFDPAVVACLAIAAAGSAGSVLLSVGLGLKACPLCFYQRTLMLSVLAVLALCLIADRSRASFAALLCLPLAIGGLAIAGFHEWLVLSGKLECPDGLFGLGTAPAQSLAAFVALSAALLIAARGWPLSIAAAVVLGLPLAWACIASAPPMPPAPDKPYSQAPDMCRPPYRASSDGI